MSYIYVLDKFGHPLMPTTRMRHVQKLLNTGKARIVSHVPFIIQLKFETTNFTQLIAGKDPGRTNIGIAVVNDKGKEFFAAICSTRNKEIRKLMEKRKAARQASRRGERKARQRLAKKFHTMFEAGCKMRKLPQCKKPITCNYIKNTEARFCNRKRSLGWVTPTVNQLIRTHLNLLRKVASFIPITDVALEVNRFAFALMENPEISGMDFQNGPLKGFDNVEATVSVSQHGKCLMCEKPIEHHHHIVPKHKNGSNTLPNIAGLCTCCHGKVHTDAEFKEKLITKKKGLLKKYGALSALNQAIPFICRDLINEYGEDHVRFVRGWETSKMRDSYGLEEKDKDTNPCHELDAHCIATYAYGIVSNELPTFNKVYQIQQFRRHDRVIIKSQAERTYKRPLGNGKFEKVATNRKTRFEQKGDSLQDWYLKQVEAYGKQKADVMVSQLKVLKSMRRYNDLNRILPGAEFWYHGQRCILTGRKNKGAYLFGTGLDGYVHAEECIFTKRNSGLVFVS